MQCLAINLKKVSWGCWGWVLFKEQPRSGFR